MFSVWSSRLVLELSWIWPFLSEAAFTVNHLCTQLPKLNPFLFLSEMFCGRNRPAGGDGASRGGREGRSGSVLDVAAENWVQDAPWEDPQRPQAPGALQTGENIQVNLQGYFYSCGKKTKQKKNPDYCDTRFIFAPSPGILMQINLLLYCVLFFLQTSATHQTTESVH